jgi:hypothetical protein
MRKIMLLIGLILITSFVLSYTPDDVSWNGFINIDFNKDTFAPDEDVTGKIIISNLADVPIVGERIVLQVATGPYSYPSQASEENVIHEEIISDIWVLPHSMKSVNFNIGTIPSGNYRLDAYSWIMKTKFIGSNAIYLSPQQENFTISAGNPLTDIEIVRSTTWFGDAENIGPVGFPVDAGEKFSGKVFIENNSGSASNNLQLEISICDWSNAFCETPEITKINIPKLVTGINEIDVELTAPELPSAYEINIALKTGDEKVSMYKNRVIVAGGTAKIRKVSIDGLKEKDYSITALIAGSPDHFNNPAFENFKLELETFNGDTSLTTDEKSFSKIEVGEVLGNTFEIGEQSFTKACLKVTKSGKLYDEECFTVPLGEIQVAYDEKFPEVLKVDWSFNKNTGELSLRLFKEINKHINARIRILGQNEILFDESIEQDGEVQKSYSLEKKNYTLVIDDKDAKRQIIVLLELEDSDSTDATNNDSAKTTCPGNVCATGNVCSEIPIETDEGTCCMAECIPAVSLGGLGLLLPLVFWGAIIVFIIAIVILLNALGKFKGRKK